MVNLRNDYVSNFDKVSFDSKKLIPTEFAFNNKYRASECLKRVKKMESKGFSLPKETRESLERIAKVGILFKIKELFSFGEKLSS